MPTLQIVDTAAAGEGVGRLQDGRVAFVPNTWPGDRVEVCLTKSNKRWCRAEVQELVEASPQRHENSPCAHPTCGGCNWKHFEISSQQQQKQQRVCEIFQRLANIPLHDLPLHIAPDGSWGLRHRIRLHSHYADTWQFGFYAQGSHALATYSECPAMWPELATAVRQVTELLAQLPRRCQLGDLELAYSRIDQKTVIGLQSTGNPQPIIQTLQHAPAAGSLLFTDNDVQRIGEPVLRYDHPAQQTYSLYFEPGVFTQANPSGNTQLVNAVSKAAELCSAQRLCELHAGHGNLSLPLAQAGIEVLSIEQNPRAVAFAQRSSQEAGLSIDARCGFDDDAHELWSTCDTLLLDPPRCGAKELCQQLSTATTPPQNIIYVSCDAATMARDITLLKASGWQLQQLELFDIFPNTPHIELLGVLQRA